MQNQSTRQSESELLNTVLQLLTEQGHSGFAEGIRLLVNEAMRQERASVLQAQPYERTDTRLGHANGYKSKTVSSGLGSITFQVPQVRGDQEFYPSALEKGLRSEQALKLALAESMCRASRRAKSPPSSNSSAASPSAPPRSVSARPGWTLI